MMWWKGNGLWMATLIALVVVGASKSMGPRGVPLGLAAAAAIVFGLRRVFEDASFFSIPTKVWPPLLLALAALIYLSGR